jgi:hypothetical protein
LKAGPKAWPVADMVEAIRDQVIALRSVEANEQWLRQVLAPGVRVKMPGVDVFGIDEALRPVEQLVAGPSAQPDINQYLANLRPGDCGTAFTVNVPPRKQRR